MLLLVGDFNTFKLNKSAADNGLSQIVNEATHGVHTLDMCFTSRHDLFKWSVVSAHINDGMIFDAVKRRRN